MVQQLVGCGHPVPDHTIVIVDPDSSRELGEGEVGEILIQGPSLTRGYWNRGEENEQVFGAHVDGREGRFLRTGDLGFFRDGELFVTGRLKDVIIIRGRNHYPQDIEQSAEGAHPAVLPGAAFAVTDDDGEHLVVVHQIDRQFRDADHHHIVQAMRRAIVEQHELDPHAIVLIRQTSLPITSSGKVQRNLCREQYLADELKVVHKWVSAVGRKPPKKVAESVVHLHEDGVSWREQAADAATAANGAPTGSQRPRRESHLKRRFGAGREGAGAASRIELDRTTERIEEWLLKWLIARLNMDPADVARDRPFAEFGVDSLTAVELSQELEDEFEVPLPAIVAWNYPTPAALARYLAEQSLGIGEPASQPAAPPTSINGAELPPAPNDEQLAALLAEIENLSDEDAARLLNEEQQRG
jgi:acyl carrier protein